MIIFDLFRNNKYNEIISLIPNIDINLRDENGVYLLQYAIISNQINIIKAILLRSPNLSIFDRDGHSILYYPIMFGFITIITILLKHDSEIVNVTDKRNNTPLHYAVNQNNYDIVKLLLKYNINIFTINNDGYNPFHLASSNNNNDIMKLIVDYDNNIIDIQTENGETALHIASNNNFIGIVKYLVMNNAQINVQENDMELTPLMYSINLRYINISKFLLEHKADINMQNSDGDSILHDIFMTDNRDIVEYVFKNFHNTIDYNIYNSHLELIIHKCLKSPKINVSFLHLLIKNSDMNFSDIDGNTPFYLLIESGLWINYKDILTRKKLNLFTNKKHVSMLKIIDAFDSKTRNIFDNMIINSYINRLQQHPNKWDDDDDNRCSINPTKECHNIIYDKIFKNQIGKPIIKKRHTICQDELNTCIKCTYSGFHIDVLAGIIYLTEKHNNACSIVHKISKPNIQRDNYFNLISRKGPSIEMEILWFGTKIIFPDHLNDYFINNVKCRYLIIPIGIIIKEGNHANYLIYDKNTNEAERFEPYGSRYLKQFDYNPELLDYNIKNKLNEIIPNITYLTPSDYLPNIGFQYIDASSGQQFGYCGLWAIFYVDKRLTYPNINRAKLVRMLIKKIVNSGLSFREYIESYSVAISSIRDKALNSANISVSKYCKQNYNDSDEIMIIDKLLEFYNNNSV